MARLRNRLEDLRRLARSTQSLNTQVNILVQVLCYDFQWAPDFKSWWGPQNMKSHLTREWKLKHQKEWAQYLGRNQLTNVVEGG